MFVDVDLGETLLDKYFENYCYNCLTLSEGITRFSLHINSIIFLILILYKYSIQLQIFCSNFRSFSSFYVLDELA